MVIFISFCHIMCKVRKMKSNEFFWQMEFLCCKIFDRWDSYAVEFLTDVALIWHFLQLSLLWIIITWIIITWDKLEMANNVYSKMFHVFFCKCLIFGNVKLYHLLYKFTEYYILKSIAYLAQICQAHMCDRTLPGCVDWNLCISGRSRRTLRLCEPCEGSEGSVSTYTIYM